MPSHLPAMLEQPAGLSTVLMNFKPFVCDQVYICAITTIPPSSSVNVLKTDLRSYPSAFFLTRVGIRSSDKESMPAKILAHCHTGKGDDENRRNEPHFPPVNVLQLLIKIFISRYNNILVFK